LETDIIGILPMGGRGARLGLPFPKPLAPTITGSGLVLLYRHALGHLRSVTDDVRAIVTSDTRAFLQPSLEHDGIGIIQTSEELLPGALADSARCIINETGGNPWLAVALPDSIWKLHDEASFADVLDARRRDGALALFIAGADELDHVLLAGERVASVTTKTGQRGMGMVKGWGAFVIRAYALANFTNDEKDGPQLGRLDMGWAFLGNSVDLGTPERYIRWHDTRFWIV
jgi:hypothetical protein